VSSIPSHKAKAACSHPQSHSAAWETQPPAQQLPHFAPTGKQMADDKKASEYNIEGGSVLHLVLALRGGL